jgi:Na+-transporting NADH:ubiquinone oxidoreductase subunit A
MAVHSNRKGLDLPLAGAPVLQISEAAPSRRVALLAADLPGVKPALAVQVGDRVLRGQKLFEDKRIAGVAFTSPAAGTVAAVHRGERRALVSLVIDVDPGDGPAQQVKFASFNGRGAADLDAGAVRALMQESGMWTALRQRPFGHVPAADGKAGAIFVTATDSRPHAPPPALVIGPRADDFRAGLACLTRLGAGPVYLCAPAGEAIDAPAGVQVEQFTGPHPSGTVGWHIHCLHPVSMERHVWHIGYQDVIALGHLVRTGLLDVARVISLAGPSVRQPRLLRTRQGAGIDELIAGELHEGEHRVISGSVLDGRKAMGEQLGYLGRYHLQVAALPEAREREMFGYLRPGGEKFSVTGTVLGAFRRGAQGFRMNTSTNGGERAMVPIGSYERVLPFDILPTFLLRALITRDDIRAQELGALELEEEDLSLATYVCPGKTEYGPLLRAALTRIEKEHG